jgi:acyl-CoA dehydrogenase
MHIRFTNVRVPEANIVLGPGRGFEISQGRLGPGRIHHCMRAIGMAEQALALMCKRSVSRVAFGKPLAKLGGNYDKIANARMNIDMGRLLTLQTAWVIDTQGVQEAQLWISKIKAVVPNITLAIIDDAMQMHGAAGISQDFPLARMYMNARTLRLADGPDEVHRMVVARKELRPYLAESR